MCGSSCILGISERLNFELGNQLLSAWLPLWPCICFWNVFLVVFFCYLWKWNIFCCDWRVPMIKLLEFLWIGMMGSFAIVLPASSIAWVVATACACAAPEFHAWHQTTKSRSSSSSTSTTLLFQKLHFSRLLSPHFMSSHLKPKAPHTLALGVTLNFAPPSTFCFALHLQHQPKGNCGW